MGLGRDRASRHGSRIPRDLGRDEPGPRGALLQPFPLGHGGPLAGRRRSARPGAGHARGALPNLKFAGTVNIDETTHGFADKVYDRAQLIELPLQRPTSWSTSRASPTPDPAGGLGRPRRIAPFGFRVLEEIHLYVDAADEIGRLAERARRAVRAEGPAQVRGAESSLDEGLAAFLAVIGEEFPLARAKTELMREDYAAHGSPASSETHEASAAPVGVEQLRDIVHGARRQPRPHRRAAASPAVASQGPDPRGTLDLRRPRSSPGAASADPQPAQARQPRRARHACSRVFDAAPGADRDVHENRVVLHAVQEVRARADGARDAGEAEASELLRGSMARSRSAPVPGGRRRRSVGSPGRPTATLAGDPLYRSVLPSWLVPAARTNDVRAHRAP